MSLLGLIGDAVPSASEMLDPSDGIDLLGMLIVGLPMSLPAVAALIVTIRGQRRGRERARKIDAKTDEIHENTVNDHDTNMREDLDEIRDMLRDGFRHMERDIGGLREEMRTERQERIAGDQRRCNRPDC